MEEARILVIKLGALGDFIQALGPLQAIRDHHPDHDITLLTTAPYEDLARASGTVDQIWLDDRPRFYQPGKWLALRARLRSGNFARVYDLQTSDRSSAYFRLFPAAARPQWSGIARGCSHPHDNPGRDLMHTRDRQREQLHGAGIQHVPASDLSWVKADTARFQLTAPYGLLVPGGAAHRPGKRWPPGGYQALARHLVGQGVTPVVLGARSEQGLARAIVKAVPGTVDLAGATSLLEIAALARAADLAVGNDTGPMHVITAAGCPALVLFSAESDPALCAPRGNDSDNPVAILRRDDLARLAPSEVIAELPARRTA